MVYSPTLTTNFRQMYRPGKYTIDPVRFKFLQMDFFGAEEKESPLLATHHFAIINFFPVAEEKTLEAQKMEIPKKWMVF